MMRNACIQNFWWLNLKGKHHLEENRDQWQAALGSTKYREFLEYLSTFQEGLCP
jgi:hypothetical protein